MKSIKHAYWLRFTVILMAVIVLNIILQNFFIRLDLTSDKRYTLANISKETMKSLSEPVFINVYLDGEMPIGLKKLRQSLVEMLDELQVYSKGKLSYQLVNPSEGSEQKREAMHRELFSKGLTPIMVQESDREGGESQRMIFPGAVVNYGRNEKPINFLSNNPMLTEDENLSLSIQNLEFELTSAISLISRTSKPGIAFIEGHDELNEYEVGDITRELSQYYNVDRVTLNGRVGILDEYRAAIIAKPRTPWNEADKLVVDQYLMNGGSVAWFIDAVHVAEDSLNQGAQTFALINNHELNDQLFKYGVRVNPTVIQDLSCALIPVNVSASGQQAQFKPQPWYYHPLLFPPSSNPITKGINVIKAQYPSSIDTVGSNPDIQKTILLTTSAYAKEQQVPFVLSLAHIMTEKVDENSFNQPFIPIAMLAEGSFSSVFTNRITSAYNNGQTFDFKGVSQPAKIAVAADGDIIRNDVTYRSGGPRIASLGYDRYMNQTFGNKEFVKNIMLYLTDDNELLDIRKKDFQLRLLDRQKVTENRTILTITNVVLPILLLIIAAICFIGYRKYKYSR